MSEDNLRAAYIGHLANQTRGDRTMCPPPELMEALARGAQGGSPNIAALDHVLTCPHCRPEFELVRAVAMSTRAAPPRPARFTVARAALAATVVLALGLGGEAWRRSRTPVLRGDASEVTLVAPDATASPEGTRRLVWRAVPGTATYEVELIDTTGTLLLSRSTTDTVLALTDAEAAEVSVRGAFDWLVTARRADGNERRSALTRVRVTPNAAR